MGRQATWSNDGIIKGFGRHTIDNDVGTVAGGAGKKKTLTMAITLADLADAAVDTSIPPQAAQIKRGSIITGAWVVVTTAAVGASAELDIGTWGRGTLTTPAVDDANGICDAIGVAELNAVGEVHICDGALVSASGNTAAAGVVAVGATSDSDCVISYSYDAAQFTDGVVELTVEYIEPQYDDSVTA